VAYSFNGNRVVIYSTSHEKTNQTDVAYLAIGKPVDQKERKNLSEELGDGEVMVEIPKELL